MSDAREHAENVIEAQFKDISGETDLEQHKKSLNNLRIRLMRSVEVGIEIVGQITQEMQNPGTPEEMYEAELMRSEGIVAQHWYRKMLERVEAHLSAIHQQTAPSIVVPDTTLVDEKGNPIGQG